MSLPPHQPPDLRDPNRRRQGQQQPQPQQPYGQQPQPPNWGNQPPQYPPQQPQYPPQQPPYQQPYQQPPQRPLQGTGPLNPMQVPQLGQQYTSQPPIPPAQARPLGARGMIYDATHERRIEYLAWGIVVILMGFSIIMVTLDTDFATDFLLIATPLLSGVILLGSGFVQRLFFDYDVSLATWALAILGISFGCTRAIAEITENTEVATQIIYFVGLLVIISGLVIILQVFRTPGGHSE